jgi:hypothetical protein
MSAPGKAARNPSNQGSGLVPVQQKVTLMDGEGNGWLCGCLSCGHGVLEKESCLRRSIQQLPRFFYLKMAYMLR